MHWILSGTIYIDRYASVNPPFLVPMRGDPSLRSGRRGGELLYFYLF